MSIHEKALEAAEMVRDGVSDNCSLEPFIQAYITTLLDSPELVEKIAIKLAKNRDGDDLNWQDMHTEKYQAEFIDQTKTVIAAIKKEAWV